MAGKVMKFAEKVKKIKRTDTVPFTTDEGETIEFKVESRSEKQVDEVNTKYEAMKPKVPTKRLPAAGGRFKIVEDHENPDYKIKMAEVQKQNFAELALLFLAEEERPEGNIDEQLTQIMEVELAGFVPKIVQRGLEISALIDEEENYEEELEAAKND
ncbi:hypothetical protein [Bacillus licheniformis]|uniref:hypothetical protein n=1 Tax=Bacillus licheniformis TaxID=1402 RepID=UPI0009B7CA39|nr:hypothetical protein [Bacillus licheniformis]ARC72575.1 hypothetical protein B37_00522 [Bacillus licheniformis]ARW56560.1 hypothetical protein S100027_04596 [Bacillus licheniformis]AXF87829.1 hypothetical protein BLDA23_05890 [Bacillus licheniformis]